jgi:hypothetical protein
MFWEAAIRDWQGPTDVARPTPPGRRARVAGARTPGASRRGGVVLQMGARRRRSGWRRPIDFTAFSKPFRRRFTGTLAARDVAGSAAWVTGAWQTQGTANRGFSPASRPRVDVQVRGDAVLGLPCWAPHAGARSLTGHAHSPCIIIRNRGLKQAVGALPGRDGSGSIAARPQRRGALAADRGPIPQRPGQQSRRPCPRHIAMAINR